MIDISFEIGGRKINPRRIGDALERALIEGIESEISRKVKNIRNPESDQNPKIIVKGRNLRNLSVEIEGSPEVVEMIRDRLF